MIHKPIEFYSICGYKNPYNTIVFVHRNILSMLDLHCYTFNVIPSMLYMCFYDVFL